VASRNAKEMVEEGKGVGGSGFAVFLDFADAIKRLGEETVKPNTVTCLICISRSPTKTRTNNRCVFTLRFTIPWAAFGLIIT
jgi:hypothetical protein